ncbi:MAG: TerC family protein [Phycisphaerae bacterium]|nr:TerC family protein [Phycisphaerae bacterium]
MTHQPLFPVENYWWLYAAFLGLVFVLLAVDLGILNRKAKEVSIATAARWTAVWTFLALAFNALLWFWAREELTKPSLAAALAASGYGEPAEAARRLALEFLSGYIVEISLSVDNLFVFVVLFAYFRVPPTLRHRVLFYGILGALLFRGIFIALGSVLFQFQWIVVVFGIFLALTGVKLLFASDGLGPDPGKNWVIKLLHRFLPVTDDYRGDRFIVSEQGRRWVTPLFVTLIAVELTDILFAIDSIPAIYGITKEPLIVFTSNVFAILGLRSLFFVLAGAMDRFHLLRYGLGVVLVFVGLKMTVLFRLFDDGHFPTEWSLGIIVLTLGSTLLASLLFPKRAESDVAAIADAPSRRTESEP